MSISRWWSRCDDEDRKLIFVAGVLISTAHIGLLLAAVTLLSWESVIVLIALDAIVAVIVGVIVAAEVLWPGGDGYDD